MLEYILMKSTNLQLLPLCRSHSLTTKVKYVSDSLVMPELSYCFVSFATWPDFPSEPVRYDMGLLGVPISTVSKYGAG